MTRNKTNENLESEREANNLDCIKTISSYFPRALGSLYVRKYFNENSKVQAMEMIKNIKREFEENLNGIEWMDEETKAAAKLKLEKMNYQVGFAEELLDDAKLIELHNKIELKIDENEYYESTLSVQGAFRRKRFEIYQNPIDKNNWVKFITPITVNAYYSPKENTMKFPGAILQGEFFNDQRPQYMNYGAIGKTRNLE